MSPHSPPPPAWLSPSWRAMLLQLIDAVPPPAPGQPCLIHADPDDDGAAPARMRAAGADFEGREHPTPAHATENAPEARLTRP